jgi:prefoldin alpha subunit
MKDDLQKLVVQFQILEANLKALQERADMLNETVAEIDKTKIAIEELEKTKPSKSLIPLGSGSFVSGKIENTEDVIIGVGSGVAINKKRKDAIAILDTRLSEFENNLNDITKQMTKTAFELEKIQERAESMQR